MKKFVICMLAIVAQGICTTHAQIITGFGNIVNWTGTGANQAALVVDFHDGTSKQSFVWGYRWDGAATGLNMLTAISSLTTMGLTVDNPSYVTLISHAESGITHSQDAYAYPFNYGWSYWIAGGSADIYSNDSPYGVIGTLDPAPNGGTAFPSGWTASPSGNSTRYLANGSWDAYSFGTFDTSNNWAPEVPPGATSYAAIPEPSALPLILLGIGTLLYARKRLHAC